MGSCPSAQEQEEEAVSAPGSGLGGVAASAKPSLAALGKPRIGYIDFPGLAEPFRMILTLGGIEFENVFIIRSKADGPGSWKELKPTTQWKDYPFLQMTGDGGTEAIHATAICRFLGKLVTVDGKKLYPDDPVAALSVDVFTQCVDECRLKMFNTFTLPNEEKTKKREQMFSEDGDITAILNKMNANMASEFFVGTSMTVADIFFGWWVGSILGVPEDVINKYPKLKALQVKVLTLPQLVPYFSKKAETNEAYKAFIM